MGSARPPPQAPKRAAARRRRSLRKPGSQTSIVLCHVGPALAPIARLISPPPLARRRQARSRPSSSSRDCASGIKFVGRRRRRHRRRSRQQCRLPARLTESQWRPIWRLHESTSIGGACEPTTDWWHWWPRWAWRGPLEFKGRRHQRRFNSAWNSACTQFELGRASTRRGGGGGSPSP